jgi:hypothetical protein
MGSIILSTLDSGTPPAGEKSPDGGTPATLAAPDRRAQRVMRAPAFAQAQPQPRHSHVGKISHERIAGWAGNPERDNETPEVVILIDGKEIGRARCDLPRPDLKRSGIFTGERHGFRYNFSPPLEKSRDWRIAVRFADTGVPLRGGDALLKAGAEKAVRLLPPRQQPAPRAASPMSPILITAPGRSGTTFLMQRLAQSPQICAVEIPPLEVRLLSYWATVYQILTAPADFAHSTHPDRLEGDGYLVGSNPFLDARYRRAFTDTAPLMEYFGQYIPEGLLDFIRSSVAEYYVRLRADKGKNQAKFFVEKGNNINRNSRGIIKQAYPELREVILLRNPLDLYCSQRAYFKRDDDRAFAQVSHSCGELLLLWWSRSDDQHFIRYEDMMLEQADCFRRLSEFLGVPDLDRGDTATETAIFKVHATSESPAASIGRWKNLPPDTIGKCKDAWAEFLAEFGYDRH